ncbi:hypothetical protein CW711_06175 [Candidatus Bathyarchaeota archaeon]|nr:MAG: hypothetical protein CW711_06175 [Candidatus Bathyarchaeota archaeon]
MTNSEYFMEFLKIGERREKPRDVGLTMSGDWGLTIMEAERLLELVGDYIDLIKFAMVTGRLCRKDYIIKKNKIYEKYDIITFPGGVLFECAILQNKIHEFLREAREVGCGAVEISTSEMRAMPLELMCKLTEIASKDYGFKVIVELGGGSSHHPVAGFKVAETIHEINTLLKRGAWKVILEGDVLRFMGAGKTPEGTRDLKAIVDAVGHENLIFETGGDREFTEWLIETYGPEVNVGNVPIMGNPMKVFELEAARRRIVQTIRSGRIPAAVLRMI